MTGAGTLQTSTVTLRPYQAEALARLARENRALQEELRRLRRALAGDSGAEAARPGAPGRQQAER